MPVSHETLTETLRAAFPDAEIVLEDLAGDDDHWSVVVRSAAFAGKPRIACHREVYAALGGMAGVALHALQVRTEVL